MRGESSQYVAITPSFPLPHSTAASVTVRSTIRRLREQTEK